MLYSAAQTSSTGEAPLAFSTASSKPRIFVDSIESLEAAMHSHIPISRAMEIAVTAYDGESITLKAPLQANINHQQSAFGGSLFSVAALAGWGLMQLKLSELLLDCNTVVMSGEVAYQRPVKEALVCVCSLPDDYEKAFDTLARDGATAMTVNANFDSNGKPAMSLSARYHIRKHDNHHKTGS